MISAKVTSIETLVQKYSTKVETQYIPQCIPESLSTTSLAHKRIKVNEIKKHTLNSRSNPHI